MKTIIISLSFTILIASCSGGKKSSASVSASYKDQISSRSELIKGIKENHLNNPQDAQTHFEKASIYNSSNDAAYFELARLAYEEKAYPKADYYVDLAISISSENYWYLELKNRILRKLLLEDELINNYLKIINLKPKKKIYYVELADIHIRNGDFTSSIEVLNRLEGQIGITPEISHQKASIYEYLKNENQLYNEYQRLIEAFPNKVDFQIDLAEAYLKFGKKSEAQDLFEKINQKYPNKKTLKIKLAKLAWDEKNYTEYFEHLNQILPDYNIHIDKKIELAIKYFAIIDNETKYEDEAIELSKLITKAHPEEAKAYALLGDFLYNTGKLKEAKEEYINSIKRSQNVFTVWHQLLMIDFELGNYESVITTGDDCLNYFPNQGIVYFLKGISMLQLKQFELSIKVFKNGLDLAFGNRVLKAELLSNLGEAYYRIQDYSKSDSSFIAAINIDSSNAVTLNNFSFYLSERDTNLLLALRYIARAVKIKPSQASFEDTYAWILYRLGRFKEARKWIEKALINGGNQSPVIVDHFGDILFKLDDKDKAMEQWIKAKELGLDTDELKSKIENKNLDE